MAGHRVLPSLLEAYLPPSQDSLTLITGTLGATPGWLILRILAALTSEASQLPYNTGIETGSRDNLSCVTLASWLHDPPFWRESARKLPIKSSKVKYLDFLRFECSPSLSEMMHLIKSALPPGAIQAASALILDGLDYCLASAQSSPQELLRFVVNLRQNYSRIFITAQADASFMYAQTTPLELSQASFVMSLAHQAEIIMSLRELESGAAKDVSGTLRITRGGQGEWITEKECLYFVERGGKVAVFEKGT